MITLARSVAVACILAVSLHAAPAPQFGTCYRLDFSPCVDCPTVDSAECVQDSEGDYRSCTIVQSGVHCPSGVCDYGHVVSGAPCPLTPK